MPLKIEKKQIDHFQKVDPILYDYITSTEIPPRGEEGDYFTALVRNIVFQQVSGAAGEAVYKRLGAFTPITPNDILNADDEDLRGCGLSYRKVSYVKSIAEHILNRSVHFDQINTMTNDEIIQMLVQIKGVGVWTAQMFMMFTLLKEDVDAYGDLAVRRGFKYLYGLEDDPTPVEYASYVEKWSPFNTYACFALWKASVDPKFTKK